MLFFYLKPLIFIKDELFCTPFYLSVLKPSNCFLKWGTSNLDGKDTGFAVVNLKRLKQRKGYGHNEKAGLRKCSCKSEIWY